MSNRKKDPQGLDPEVTEKLRSQAAELVEQVNAGDYGRTVHDLYLRREFNGPLIQYDLLNADTFQIATRLFL